MTDTTSNMMRAMTELFRVDEDDTYREDYLWYAFVALLVLEMLLCGIFVNDQVQCAPWSQEELKQQVLQLQEKAVVSLPDKNITYNADATDFVYNPAFVNTNCESEIKLYGLWYVVVIVVLIMMNCGCMSTSSTWIYTVHTQVYEIKQLPFDDREDSIKKMEHDLHKYRVFKGISLAWYLASFFVIYLVQVRYLNLRGITQNTLYNGYYYFQCGIEPKYVWQQTEESSLYRCVFQRFQVINFIEWGIVVARATVCVSLATSVLLVSRYLKSHRLRVSTAQTATRYGLSGMFSSAFERLTGRRQSMMPQMEMSDVLSRGNDSSWSASSSEHKRNISTQQQQLAALRKRRLSRAMSGGANMRPGRGSSRESRLERPDKSIFEAVTPTTPSSPDKAAGTGGGSPHGNVHFSGRAEGGGPTHVPHPSAHPGHSAVHHHAPAPAAAAATPSGGAAVVPYPHGRRQATTRTVLADSFRNGLDSALSVLADETERSHPEASALLRELMQKDKDDVIKLLETVYVKGVDSLLGRYSNHLADEHFSSPVGSYLPAVGSAPTPHADTRSHTTARAPPVVDTRPRRGTEAVMTEKPKSRSGTVTSAPAQTPRSPLPRMDSLDKIGATLQQILTPRPISPRPVSPRPKSPRPPSPPDRSHTAPARSLGQQGQHHQPGTTALMQEAAARLAGQVAGKAVPGTPKGLAGSPPKKSAPTLSPHGSAGQLQSQPSFTKMRPTALRVPSLGPALSPRGAPPADPIPEPAPQLDLGDVTVVTVDSPTGSSSSSSLSGGFPAQPAPRLAAAPSSKPAAAAASQSAASASKSRPNNNDDDEFFDAPSE